MTEAWQPHAAMARTLSCCAASAQWPQPCRVQHCMQPAMRTCRAAAHLRYTCAARASASPSAASASSTASKRSCSLSSRRQKARCACSAARCARVAALRAYAAGGQQHTRAPDSDEGWPSSRQHSTAQRNAAPPQNSRSAARSAAQHAVHSSNAHTCSCAATPRSWPGPGHRRPGRPWRT